MKKETLNNKLKVRSAYKKGKRVGYAEGDEVNTKPKVRNARAEYRGGPRDYSRGETEAQQSPKDDSVNTSLPNNTTPAATTTTTDTVTDTSTDTTTNTPTETPEEKTGYLNLA